MKRTSPERLEELLRVEYLAMSLVQKLRNMESPMNDFLATASAFGVDYTGPNFAEELDDLFHALKGETN